MSTRALAIAGWSTLAALVLLHVVVVALTSIDALGASNELRFFGPIAVDVALGTLAFGIGVATTVRARAEKRTMFWGLPIAAFGALAAGGGCCFGAFIWGLGESFSGYGGVV